MNNYEFAADWVQKHAAGRPNTVLDYGCGAGQIVALLRRGGLDAWGCDVYYEGGDASSLIPRELQPYIRRMPGNTIPYDDVSFDVVLSNQVFEHVPDMESALVEIARVLKPGGVSLNLFPDRGVWREGHSGIPFLHWFPKNTKSRVYYAALLRSLGLGHFTQGKTILGWSRDFCVWLDRWTYYRSLTEIHERFGRIIGKTRHAEEDLMHAHFDGRLDAIPRNIQRFVVRKMAGVVLVSLKRRDHRQTSALMPVRGYRS
jgi:SAM-dependent methyltransferase